MIGRTDQSLYSTRHFKVVLGQETKCFFCVRNISNIFVRDKNVIFSKNICRIIKQNPILIEIPYRIWVELLALHVHFTCLGFNCQCKSVTMPSGIYTIAISVAPSPTRNINCSSGESAQNHAEWSECLYGSITHFSDLGLVNLWSNR